MTRSGIKDTGARFQIVTSTRKITVPVAYKVIGTVGDHLSEQLTFQCPRFIDGHDIKECSDKYITWQNPNGEIGHDHLGIVGEDNDDLLFTWDVRGNTTVKAGVVSFSIHFEDYSEDGIITYRWSTAECKECEIINTVNAAIGVYELIYVDGDTLVFADQTPVRDDALLLETMGVVPDGTKFIDSNGHHDVAGLASVDVAVPTDGRPPIIEVQDGGLVVASDGTTVNRSTYQLDTPTINVTEDGLVSASNHGMETTHQLSKADCKWLLPSCIMEGITIFGVTGTMSQFMTETLEVTVRNFTDYDILIDHYVRPNNEHRGCAYPYRTGADSNGTMTMNVVKGTPIKITAAQKLDVCNLNAKTLGGGDIAQSVYSDENGIGHLYVETKDYNAESSLTLNIYGQA